MSPAPAMPSMPGSGTWLPEEVDEVLVLLVLELLEEVDEDEDVEDEVELPHIFWPVRSPQPQ